MSGVKAFATANQNKEKCLSSQCELKIKIQLPKAREKAQENAGDQVVLAFNFASDWLRGWREFPGPITVRNKAKLTQSRFTFDLQLTIALVQCLLN